MNAPATSLIDRWKALLSKEPKLRIRDAAEKLDASEAELLATEMDCKVTPLEPKWKTFMETIAEEAGSVMCLTRNDWVVIEKTGPFEELEFDGPVGVTLGDYMDFRIFWSQWNVGYAVVKELPDRVLRSFQIFDHHGDSVLKIYLNDDAQADVFAKLTEQLKASEPAEPVFKERPAPHVPQPAPEGFDEARWQEEWLALEDTHDFYPMRRKHRIDRLTSLNYAPEGYAWQLKNDVLETLLTEARDRKLDIMVFVNNRGNIEIHTGPVKNIKRVGEYMNVLDPEFNLHFKEEGIHEVWVVRKPTVDGIVTAVEFYHADGSDIAMFFGRRQPGDPELEVWRELVNDLPRK